jgi:hypothetical protein
VITLGKKRRKKSNRSSSLTSLLIVSGIVILIVAVAMLKNGSATDEGVADIVLPETQLAQAIAAQKPTLAFYHSNTCDTCIQMVEIVALVYPEFSGGLNWSTWMSMTNGICLCSARRASAIFPPWSFMMAVVQVTL